MGHAPRTPGALNQIAAERPTIAEDVTTRELATELLARLRTGEPLKTELAIVLAFALEAASNAPNNRLSIDALHDNLNAYRGFPSALPYLPRVSGTFVELGAGSINPLANGLLNVMLGHDCAIAFDLQPPQDVSVAVKGLSRVIMWMLMAPELVLRQLPIRFDRNAALARIASLDMGKLLSGDPSGLDENLLSFRQCAAEKLDLADGEAEVVASNAFLEHVMNPEAVVAELARVTRVGGAGVHNVDCRDHRSYGDTKFGPLDFLAEETWLGGSTNRIRPSTFHEMFLDHGFDVIRDQRHAPFEPGDALLDSFVEPFRTMPRTEFEHLGVRFLLRRR